LVPVGCAPLAGANQSANAALATEDELCARVLETQSARDANVLLRTYPSASCIPATLAALPPSTLSAISPQVLTRLPLATRLKIPSEAARHLRFAELGGGGSPAAASGGGPY
jgi:hypothetical protein